MGRKKKDAPTVGLVIDKQLRAISPIISAENRRELESNIMAGNTVPIVVWHNTILAGFDEYEICQARGLPVNVKTLPCFNLPEAIEWACAYLYQTCSDRNESYKRYWIGLRYNNARENKRASYLPIEEDDIYDHILNRVRQNRTAVKIAKELQMSQGAVQKYGLYAKAINSIMSKNPVMATSILQERIHVSQTNILLLEQLSAEELRRVNYRFDLGSAKIVGISSEPESPPPVKQINQPGIKSMPEYDPDAELAGLLLTAKSWTGSLERAYHVADFRRASSEIKCQLHEALLSLKESIEIVCLSLEDTI